jgi:hypothetical protein
MTLREIRSNCGNRRFQTLKARLQSSPGLFLDFSWVYEQLGSYPLTGFVRSPGGVYPRIVECRLGKIVVEAAGVEPASENVAGQRLQYLFAFRRQTLAYNEEWTLR